MHDLDLGATIKGFNPGQKVFNRYTLKKILGRGGMGVVWLALDDKLEREVALKFLPEVMMGDKLALADLKRETRRSLDLTHSHIVRIYDFVEDGRTAAIAMEYITGETLTNARVDRPGHCYEPADIAKWVGQICDALDYAHTKAKVVHRDLKPANLMIDAAGDVKVTDFGIATSIADSVSRVSKQAGSSGTPVYMAPQQMMGDKPAVTDDVYSLGATLYELLTGKPPFYTGNVFMQVQNKVPPSIGERRAELGFAGGVILAEWEQTIAACLAKEPKDRPQSAGEVAERLGLMAKGIAQRPAPNADPKVAQGAPVASAPPVSKGDGRKSKMPALAIVAGVIVVGAAGWWFGVEQPARRAAQAEAVRLANARGGLSIRTEPAGAKVTVGGVGMDESPATFNQLRLGDYEVTVEKSGYEPASVKLTVQQNQSTQPPVIVLKPSVGNAEITSEPEGLDFQLSSNLLVPAEVPAVLRRGQTPARLTDLPIGDYILITRRKGWPEKSHSLKVERGGVARVAAEFVPGSVAIESSPSGAQVVSEGGVIGKTPLRLPEVIPGPLSAELRLEGYRPRMLTGTVTARQELRLSARLDGLRSPAEVQSAMQRGGLAYFPLRSDGNDHLGKNPAMRLTNTRFENGALFLNGDYASYTATARVPGLDYNRFTVAVDFCPVDATRERQVFLVGGGSYRWLGLLYLNGQLALSLNNQHRYFYLGAQLRPREWHTIVCSVDLARRKILTMLDGELLPPVELPADFKFAVVGSDAEQSDKEFMFTNYSNAGTFHGYVANLRVFNYAVQSSDLKVVHDLIAPDRPRLP